MANEPDHKLAMTVSISMATAAVTSIIMVVVTLIAFGDGKSLAFANVDGALSNSASLIQCDAQVYSPVQNRCVDQNVFDDEMQRLFKALGVDPTIYSGD